MVVDHVFKIHNFQKMWSLIVFPPFPLSPVFFPHFSVLLQFWLHDSILRPTSSLSKLTRIWSKCLLSGIPQSHFLKPSAHLGRVCHQYDPCGSHRCPPFQILLVISRIFLLLRNLRQIFPSPRPLSSGADSNEKELVRCFSRREIWYGLSQVCLCAEGMAFH